MLKESPRERVTFVIKQLKKIQSQRDCFMIRFKLQLRLKISSRMEMQLSRVQPLYAVGHLATEETSNQIKM